MADIIVEKHVLARPDEPAEGCTLDATSTPGSVEFVIWAQGVRLRARMSGAEAVNVGTSTILLGGEALNIVRAQAQALGARELIVNGANGRRS